MYAFPTSESDSPDHVRKFDLPKLASIQTQPACQQNQMIQNGRGNKQQRTPFITRNLQKEIDRGAPQYDRIKDFFGIESDP